MGFSSIAIGSSYNLYLFLVSLAFSAIGTEVLKTSLTSIYSKVVPVEQRGTYLGVNSSLDAVVRIFMPTISGVLFQLDPSYPYHVAGFLLLLFSGYLLEFPFEIPAPGGQEALHEGEGGEEGEGKRGEGEENGEDEETKKKR